MLKFWLRSFLFFAVSFFGYAYQVSPMFQTFEVAGRASQGSYEVTNTGAQEITLQATVYQVGFNPLGEEVLNQTDDDFLILPPQSKVASQGSQRFRVRYLGDALIPQTKVYRVIFEQIRTTDDSEEDSGSVQFMVNFSTVIFVSPMNCKPQLKAHISSGNMTLENPSSCVFDLNLARFEFSSGLFSESLGWVDLDAETAGYLLPSRTQEIKLPQKVAESKKVKIISPY
ncbi:molecular chaperone [Vibrio breoganii]|uniref:Pili assembly chaperone N-terminal domain-containing protein n=1 Tax=Vibrio breoganii TaxID=553239 RepID=A0AAN0XYL9_9VIBR|nr:fimbria/pilus periplasmic chaperone [Vibrio breoganii]ANO34884.1 hypothetical protein A6E01_16995 [Vibrio breoganii]PMK40890.1 hypothetical protein BCU00_15070 [Vibrio breoganii]PMM46264.1 hypothetical protein BCT52_07610 [Vibrio breoganii]